MAIFSKEEIRAISTTRNIASHEYERLNLELIEIAIRDYLPILKEKIDKTIKQKEACLENSATKKR